MFLMTSEDVCKKAKSLIRLGILTFLISFFVLGSDYLISADEVDKRIRVGLMPPGAQLTSAQVSFDGGHGLYLPADKKKYLFQQPLWTFNNGATYYLNRLNGPCEVSTYVGASINDFDLSKYPNCIPLVVRAQNGSKAGLKLVNANTVFEAKGRQWQNSRIENISSVCAYSNSRIVFMLSNSFAVVKSTSDGPFTFSGKRYRGGISFYMPTSFYSSFFPINDLDLESYLYGVVPSEMPTSWGEEAIKAQAVCARTYAVSSLGNFAKYDYDVAPTIVSQVYGGMAAETQRGRTAVDQTSHEELFYGNDRVQAFFHASNGGFCGASEDVFATKLPYFRPKADPYSLEITTPWTVYASPQLLKNKLASNGIFIGDILNMEIKEVSPSRIIKKVAIYGTNGTRIVSGDTLRWYLGGNNVKSLYFKLVNDKASLPYESAKKVMSGGESVEVETGIGVLRNNGLGKEKLSDLVYISENGEEKSISEKQILSANGKRDVKNVKVVQGGDYEVYEGGKVGQTGLILVGYGWGHNIGMSQWGAKIMAERGHNYEEILKFYYEGTEIVRN